MAVTSISSVSDETLMRRVAEGDVLAFETIYDRYQTQAFRFALRITSQRVVAEDVTQDAFLGLWRSAALYQPSRGGLKTWLFTLVRNRGIDSLRRRSRSESISIDDVPAENLMASEHTEAEVLKHEETRRIRHVLTAIPANQREVIELAYFNELTQAEIAEDLKLPLGTVKGRLRLAQTKLHRALTNESAFART
jgi:RNA polymerase sigma-70 factor (ECF subfamily)